MPHPLTPGPRSKESWPYQKSFCHRVVGDQNKQEQGLWKFARQGDSIRRQTLIFLFISVAVVAVAIVERRLWDHCDSFARCGVHSFSAEVSRLEHKVLDGIRWNLARVFFEDDKIR